MKRIWSVLLLAVMVWTSGVGVYAESSELVIEDVSSEGLATGLRADLPCPYTLYLLGVATHIMDKGDGKIHMGVEVYCTEDMAKITTTYYLQQLVSDKWVTVCSATRSVEDTDHMIKFLVVSYPPSGTYRVKTLNAIEAYSGYTESTDGYSPQMNFVSPYL